MSRRGDPLLRQMAAYRRLAREAKAAGRFRLAEQHSGIADRCYERYLNQQATRAAQLAVRAQREGDWTPAVRSAIPGSEPSATGRT
jgi:hypothetical protein